MKSPYSEKKTIEYMQKKLLEFGKLAGVELNETIPLIKDKLVQSDTKDPIVIDDYVA